MPTNKWDYLKSAEVKPGEYILMRGVRGTRFGDTADSEDNGIGASGFHTAAHPEYIGVSLPQSRGKGVLDGLFYGCPIPKIPWFTPVRVYSPKTGKTVYAHLIDLGPHPRTKTPIDLSIGCINALGLDPEEGEYTVDFRVLLSSKE